MTALRVLRSRLLGLISSREGDARIEEEMATHVAMLAAEYEREGLSATDANAKARREFGAATQIREQHREQRRLPFLDSLWQDLRYTFRQWRTHPGFAATAIITLALGIGANSAIFQLLDLIVLRPLPVANPDALVIPRGYWNANSSGFSYPLFREMNARQHVVEGLFASGSARVSEVRIHDRVLTEPVVARFASGNYFRLLGTSAQAGRLFTEADDEPASAPVVVVSDAFWKRELGSAPDAVGRILYVNQRALTISGITRPEFFGETLGTSIDFWIPTGQIAQISPGLEGRSTTWFQPMARLRSDIPLATAQAELSVLWGQLREFSIQMTGVQNYHLELLPGRQGFDNLNTQFSKPLWVLLAISGIVGLIVCANLASLLLARATARTQEIGVRLAMGAGLRRLLRQLLTESLALAFVGGGLGLWLGTWMTRGLVALASAGEPWRLSLDLNWRVAGFTLLISMGASLVFGIAPALAATRISLATALANGTRTYTAGPSRAWATKGFVIAQVSLSLLLVAGGLLLVRTFVNVAHQDFGYETENILEGLLATDKGLPRDLFNPDVHKAIYARVKQMPGIRSSAVASGGLLDKNVGLGGDAVATPDRSVPDSLGPRLFPVTPGYVETMGIRLVKGRSFQEGDEQGPKVAVISERAATVMFGKDDPIGRSFSSGKLFQPSAAYRVIGVMKDVRFSSPREAFTPLVFGLIGQMRAQISPTVVLRTVGDPTMMAEELRRATREAAPGLKFYKVTTIRQQIQLHARRERLLAWVSGAFGALALVLASVGLYGVMAYAAERRTQEIGVRLALGATTAQVKTLLLREVAGLLVMGLTIGGIAAFWLSQLLKSLLFDLSPHDPLTFSIAVVLLSVVALLAGYVPARRAAGMDAIIALRQQ